MKRDVKNISFFLYNQTVGNGQESGLGMNLSTPGWMERQRIDLKLADQLREIGEHKGRAELYGVHVLDEMELLRQVTAEHSAAAGCHLEQSETSAEQTHYQHLALEIQDSAMKWPVEAATIIAIHDRLLCDTYREPDPTSAAALLDELCQSYREQELSTEPLLLTGAFVFELLRCQPFAAGNIRVALLVALWLLNRRGYTVGKFVSLERVFEIRKKEFQAVLQTADTDEKKGSSDMTDWWRFWLEVLLQAYRELSLRAGALSGRRGAKTDMVLAWIASAPQDFSIREIQQQVPECGIELIRKILKEQKAAGRVRCMGRGPNALWRRKKTRTNQLV